MNPERETQYERWKDQQWPGRNRRVSSSTEQERGIPPVPAGKRPPPRADRKPWRYRTPYVSLSSSAERSMMRTEDRWAVDHCGAPKTPTQAPRFRVVRPEDQEGPFRARVVAAREAYFVKYGRYPQGGR